MNYLGFCRDLMFFYLKVSILLGNKALAKWCNTNILITAVLEFAKVRSFASMVF